MGEKKMYPFNQTKIIQMFKKKRFTEAKTIIIIYAKGKKNSQLTTGM